MLPVLSPVSKKAGIFALHTDITVLSDSFDLLTKDPLGLSVLISPTLKPQVKIDIYYSPNKSLVNVYSHSSRDIMRKPEIVLYFA